MSDLNDLIRTNATRAYYTGKTQGALEERERIIKLIDDLAFHINSVEHNPEEAEGAYRALALIKGEQK